MQDRRPSGRHPHLSERIDRNSPCPCGSGLKAKNCLPKDPSQVHPASIQLRLDKDLTGFGHASCALRELRSCSSSVSIEHFVSQAVQHVLAAASEDWGLPPAPAIVMDGARVLCENHNSALSVLDSVGKRLAEGLCGASLAIFGKTPSKWDGRFVQVNGFSVEQFLLKMLIGATYAGFAGVGPEVMKRREAPPPTWILDMLRTGRQFNHPNGLYVKASLDADGGPVSRHGPDIGFKPLFDAEGVSISGIAFRLFGIDLILWASGDGSAPRVDLGDLAYRPEVVGGRSQRASAMLKLSWPQPHYCNSVMFRPMSLSQNPKRDQHPLWSDMVNRHRRRAGEP